MADGSEQLLKCREDRKAAKAAVSRAYDKIEKGISVHKFSKETLYGLVLNLEKEFSFFLDINDDFSAMCDEEQVKDSVKNVSSLNVEQYCESVQKKYTEGKALFESHVLNLQAAPLTVAMAPPPATPPNPPPTTPSAPPSQPLYMQKIENPKFSGFHKDWPEFNSYWLKTMPGYYKNKAILAYILKKAVEGGPGKDIIAHVSAGSENAYDRMWEALESYYGNITLCVSAALSEIKSLPSVREGDNKGTVELIRAINSIYFQLEQVKQVSMVSNLEVNAMYKHLPPNMQREWGKKFTALDSAKQLHPLQEFHEFLQENLRTALLMYQLDPSYSLHCPETPKSFATTAEPQQQAQQRQSQRSGRSNHANTSRASNRNESRNQAYPSQNNSRLSSQNTRSAEMKPQNNQGQTPPSQCIIHANASGKHTTQTCRNFIGLPPSERRALIVNAVPYRCKRCFDPTPPKGPCRCPDLPPCDGCGTHNHHQLICHIKAKNTPQPRASANLTEAEEMSDTADEEPPEEPSSPFGGYTAADSPTSNAATTKKRGCLAIYSTPVTSSPEEATVFCDDGSDASWLTESAIKKLGAKKVGPDITLNMTTLHGSKEMKCALYEIILLVPGMGEVSVIAYSTPHKISSGVSDFNPATLKKIFPKHDVSKLRRPAGPIDLLLGADYFSLHPKKEVKKSGDLSIMRGALGECVQGYHPLLSDPTSVKCYFTSISQSLSNAVNDFILADQLGTTISIKCGGCRCNKCPIPGHTYSFNEEQELSMIKDNLKYIPEVKRWRTKYPWKTDPIHLPDNYPAALATLISTEKKLRKDPEWAKTFAEQITEHEERGVARKLTPEELAAWKGPKYYLGAMALPQPDSLTTPVRLVMNSSQNYRGLSLNSFLAKGPDAYNNSMLTLLLIFRELPVVLIGDIRKMYNSIELEDLEVHVHRFLWRDLENRTPDIWAITRVNLGDRPSGTIAIVARDMTAEKFKEINPEAAEMIIRQTYTDDTINSVLNLPTAKKLAEDATEILAKGGFRYKDWVYGGTNIPAENSDPKVVLGTTWDRSDDTITFPSKINFSSKKRKQRTEPNIKDLADLLKKLPPLTRRIVLEQVMSIYDPYGFLAPLILLAKILLRETWILQLQWDEVLPDDMQEKWIEFFKQVLEASQHKYPRCLRPENAVGDPSLILLSDGSEAAYGCTAYIHWELSDGSCWARLILAKTRISPIKRISIPQTELNGAVLSSRLRKVIEKERARVHEITYFSMEHQNQAHSP